MKGIAWIIEVMLCAVLIIVMIGSISFYNYYTESWKVKTQMRIARDILYSIVSDPVYRRQIALGKIPKLNVPQGYEYFVMVYLNNSSTHTFPTLLNSSGNVSSDKNVASLSYIIAGYYEPYTYRATLVSCKHYNVTGALLEDCTSLINASDDVYLNLSDYDYAVITFSYPYGDLLNITVEGHGTLTGGVDDIYGNLSSQWVYIDTIVFPSYSGDDTTIPIDSDAISKQFKIQSGGNTYIDVISLNVTDLEHTFVYAPRKIVVGVGA